MRPIKVSARIPSGSVAIIIDGLHSLIVLFKQFVTEREGNSVRDRLDIRGWVHRFSWFIIRDLILLMVSKVTRDVSYPRCVPAKACCSIPVRENSKCHDRKKGPNSSFQEGVNIESSDIAISFFHLVRFFVCLERFAEVLQSHSSFNEDQLDMCKVPENVLARARGKICYDALACNVKDDICMACFINNVWCDRLLCDGLLHLETDETRRGTNAFPTAASNKKALQQGHMVLEDLLMFHRSVSG